MVEIYLIMVVKLCSNTSITVNFRNLYFHHTAFLPFFQTWSSSSFIIINILAPNEQSYHPDFAKRTNCEQGSRMQRGPSPPPLRHEPPLNISPPLRLKHEAPLTYHVSGAGQGYLAYINIVSKTFKIISVHVNGNINA